MSRFYVLPPRQLVGERLAASLTSLLPGLEWSDNSSASLADALTYAATRAADVFLVYREELPPEEDCFRALVNGYGAAAGDEVIEVRAGGRPGEWTTQRWQLGSC